MTKLQKKHCDAVVVNAPGAIDSPDNSIKIVDPSGEIVVQVSGSKRKVSEAIIAFVEEALMR